MSETRALITDTAERIFQDLCDKNLVDAGEEGAWPEDLWRTLEETGLTVAAVAEEQGGGGGALGDAMAVLFEAGRHAAPLPLAETFLGGWALAGSGRDVPQGPITVAANGVRLNPGEGGWVLSGTARRVPWAAQAKGIVVVAEGKGTTHVAVVDPSVCGLTPGKNLAGEPRDDVGFDGVTLSQNEVAAAGPGIDAGGLLRLGALTRAVLMAGALSRILELAVQYALDRVQFGRPIAKFQAVQQQLAVLAGEVAAAGRASVVAVLAAEEGGGMTEIAVAKARIGEAAGVCAEIAHQVHGAMGFTHEHSLHHFTRRLWSWRDEYGPEVHWQAELGRRIAERGADGLWPFLTRT